MIRADSFLLHKKSKTPPKKTGFSPSLGGLRRVRTLSQLKKYTSHPLLIWQEPPVTRGFIPDGSRSGPKLLRLLRSLSGINPLTTGSSQVRDFRAAAC
ncbi:hypothetical protein C1893_03575 [Pseudomonas sp. MPR-ANC1]|nr:hypothetical protein C1893_03575 [Pseudomonas sp. MPR-ANC1]